jgi:hypothetical protein
VWISDVSRQVAEAAQSQLEWMAESVGKVGGDTMDLGGEEVAGRKLQGGNSRGGEAQKVDLQQGLFNGFEWARQAGREGLGGGVGVGGRARQAAPRYSCKVSVMESHAACWVHQCGWRSTRWAVPPTLF